MAIELEGIALPAGTEAVLRVPVEEAEAVAERHNRLCESCGAAFGPWQNQRGRRQAAQSYAKQRFCSRSCSNRSSTRVPARGEQASRWKGDAAPLAAKRKRARKLYSLESCEQCGKPASDRHHKDGDPGNNTAENVASLCRRCHMAADGRLERFIAMGVAARDRRAAEISPCQVCSRAYKPLRRGRCGSCYAYWRSHGVERPALLGGGRCGG
jgi:protein-arginine kinase activator protein McsA